MIRRKLTLTRQVPLGELVAAVFDEAAAYTGDPWKVSLLATQAVTDLLLYARRKSTSLSRRMPSAKATYCRESTSGSEGRHS